MRSPAAFALGTLALFSALTAHADTKKLIKISRRPVSPPVLTHIKSSTVEMDISALPQAVLEPLSPRSLPSTFPNAPAELILESPSSSVKNNPFRKVSPTAKPPPTSPKQLKLAIPGAFGAGLSAQTDNHAVALGLQCTSTKAGPRQVFWEAILPTAKGARLIRAQAWFDPSSCRVGEGSRVETPLGVAARYEGKPLIYGARTPEGLLFFSPALLPAPVQNNTEQVGLAPIFHRGAISILQMNASRGGAVVFSATLHSGPLADWWYKLGEQATPTDTEIGTLKEIRIDLSQSLSEESPLALLTIQQTMARPQAPITGLGQQKPINKISPRRLIEL